MATTVTQPIINNISRAFLSALLTIFIIGNISAQQKIIKAKPFKIKYTYNQDSIAIEHQELKKICIAFTAFHDAILQKDYEAYLNALSERSKKMIPKEKLKRKFNKFISYNIKLENKLEILLVSTEGNPQSFETTPSLVFMIKLPNEQTIQKRVGFDPVKIKKMKNAEHILGLYLIKEGAGYKVTIPW